MVMRYQSLPSMSALIALEAVVRHSSFAAASRELGVSQSAISQQVKALEEALGTELVIRHRPRIAPTTNGQTIADAVRIGLDHVVGAIELVRTRGAGLTVAATTSFSSLWLMPRLPSFHARHPEVELHLRTTDSEIAPDRSDFDIGIVFTSARFKAAEQVHLFDDEIVPVCHPRYATQHVPVTRLIELAQEILLHHDLANPTWLDWPAWFEACGEPLASTRGGRHYSNYLLLVQAAKEAHGIAMGWRRLVEPYLQRGELVRVTALSVVPSASYYVVLPRRRAAHEAAHHFRDWLMDEAANDW